MASELTSTKTLAGVGTAVVTAVAVAIAAAISRGKKDAPSTSATKLETWESHVKEHGQLKEIWPGTLFVLEAAGCKRGPPIRNMIIYRVPDQSKRLVIFNAIAVDEETLGKITSLGTPTVMIVPNCYHRCCAGVWKRRFKYLLVVCPGVATKQVEEMVPVDTTTEEWANKDQWSPWVHSKTIDGWGDFENVIEVELENSLGKGKKAVLVCDLLFTVPHKENAGYAERFMVWMFDSSIVLPPEGKIIIPKVARISRIFAIKDWPAAEKWYRDYAKEHGKRVGAICVGHGPPTIEMQPAEGCTEALMGVADQLTKPRW